MEKKPDTESPLRLLWAHRKDLFYVCVEAKKLVWFRKFNFGQHRRHHRRRWRRRRQLRYYRVFQFIRMRGKQRSNFFLSLSLFIRLSEHEPNLSLDFIFYFLYYFRFFCGVIGLCTLNVSPWSLPFATNSQSFFNIETIARCPPSIWTNRQFSAPICNRNAPKSRDTFSRKIDRPFDLKKYFQINAQRLIG